VCRMCDVKVVGSETHWDLVIKKATLADNEYDAKPKLVRPAR
jgi:hypothetical protein